jgi:hypothetical protein
VATVVKHRLLALLLVPLALGAAESHAVAGKRPPRRGRKTTTAALAPPRPHELFFGGGDDAGRSPDGAYSFRLDISPREEVSRIVVWRRGVKRPIARIDPNPGGQAHNLSVRFVGGDNLLASWGCGTYCEVTVLFNPRGTKLASFGAHEVSPTGGLAVSFEAFDVPGCVSDSADVIDLRTGQKLRHSGKPGIWNTCGARWERRQVTLMPCDARTRPVVLPLPPRARKKA